MSAKPVLLVLRPLGLGDFCTAVPALRGLRRAFPRHRVLLACSPAFSDLAALTGAVDRVLPADPLRPLRGVRRPAIAVDLHGRGPSSQQILLRTAPEQLIAFRNQSVPATWSLPEWREDEHEVLRWCRLLAECGIATNPEELDLPAPPTPLARRYAGCAVLHPGAASPSRRWPVDRFATVGQHLRRRGLQIVVTGSVDEAELGHCLAARIPGAVSIAGRTSPLELLSLVGAASLLVSGDTGIGHLATATRTPSVLLFGPAPPTRWGPPPDRDQHRVLWAGVRGDPHGVVLDRALAAIHETAVIAAAEDVLSASHSAHTASRGRT